MFALQHITKSYSGQTIVDDINFVVNQSQVIALVGENGAGKTTLLKILLGEIQPDSGTVVSDHETVGYVPQEPIFGKTIEASFARDVESWQIDTAMEAVGLVNYSKTMLAAKLSAGQRTRLALAQVLTLKPTVLLFDEPTNNLDAQGLEWLEQFIRKFRGSVVLVSHDRTLINLVADKIVELHNGKLKQYGGNYDFYKAQKAIEYQSELENYQAIIEEKRQLKKAIITQQENGQHAHQHMKWSDNDTSQRDFFRNHVTRKYGQQVKALEMRLGQVENVEHPEMVKNYIVSLDGDVEPSKLVLRLENISKSYSKPILDSVNVELRGNERLHIKGVNGSGKTTLLKIAAGLLEADNGKLIIGEKVQVGYFSQDVDGLDYTIIGFENLLVTGASSTAIYREARSLGLTQSDLKKKPNSLSRGQQAKLGFAKLLLNSNQLLILDEPTNHLDILTREHIEEALQQYKGALLLASHDDYFISSLSVTKELTLKNGKAQ